MKHRMNDEELLTEEDVNEMVSHCKCYKAKDAEPVLWNIESVPEQRLADKFAKDNNIAITKYQWNENDKKLIYHHLKNAHEIVELVYTFEDVAKHYGWNGFEFSENKLMIIPQF